jgi:integrase
MAQVTEQATEKKPKRANAEGSVFFWRGRGWYAAVTGPDGRRVMRKAPKQTERGAETLLRQLLAERDRGELTRGATTLSDFLEEWLLACTRRGCRPGTVENYRKNIVLYIEPVLGRVRLQKLTPGQIEKVYDKWAEQGLAPSTLRVVHHCLHNLLKLAKRRKLVG